MSELLTCEPVPATVRSARVFIVDKLQEWGRDDLVDSAALLTSELVTNAVVHTGKPFTVRVAQLGARIRVEVADSVHVLPTPWRARADDGTLDLEHSFHGLSIVDSVASAWGSESIPGDGKVVWFELVGTADGSGRSRPAVSELSDLRPSATASGLSTFDLGKDLWDSVPQQEVPPMARREHVVDRDEVVEERGQRLRGDDDYEPRRGGVMRWILLALVIIAIAVIAFFALGGDADVDTEGDLEVPEVDADINPPDIDSEEAPPAEADANAND